MRQSSEGLRLWRFVIDNSLLLVVGTGAALVWANGHPRSYDGFAHALHFAVNDVGMVFFFGLAAKEVFEATLPGGPLASPRQAAVPLFAAAGGMIAPALIYVALVTAWDHPELVRGWAVPCATDIAFSYMAARLVFGASHPAIPFLLLLAIADDALGLVILAVVYPSGPVSPIAFVRLFAPALLVAWWLRRRQTRSVWPYVLVAGGLSWLALYHGGIPPALALVPISPFMPPAPKDLGLFDAGEDAAADTLNRFEHFWKVPVQIVLFFFGLVNAGVALSSVGVGTWAVLLALVLGKPLGIWLFTETAARAGFRRGVGLSSRDVFILGWTAAIGFTVSLFFATAAFVDHPALDEVKMGALLSFIAAPSAWLLARLMGVRKAGLARAAPRPQG